MHTRSEKELERVGAQYGARLLRTGMRPRAKNATVLALVGELGAGKTTFLRGFAKGLGLRRRITSPTFVIARRYKIPSSPAVSYKAISRNAKNRGVTALQRYSLPAAARRAKEGATAGYRWFWHFDCYRLRNAHDLAELGFHEIIRDPHALIALEWADRIRGALPPKTAWIAFSHHPKGRKVVMR